jgi:hypothetical protein
MMSDVTAGGRDPTNLLALPIGAMLHDYEIRAILGQGGFGITRDLSMCSSDMMRLLHHALCF